VFNRGKQQDNMSNAEFWDVYVVGGQNSDMKPSTTTGESSSGAADASTTPTFGSIAASIMASLSNEQP
jgi:hypothetical protein